MLEYPEIFTKDMPAMYESKSGAAADAALGWWLYQHTSERPERFSVGMELIAEYLEEPVNPTSCRYVYSKWKIREDRAARELSQSGYAELFNVSIDTVKAWEAGRREPAPYFWFLITFSNAALKIAGRKANRR